MYYPIFTQFFSLEKLKTPLFLKDGDTLMNHAFEDVRVKKVGARKAKSCFVLDMEDESSIYIPEDSKLKFAFISNDKSKKPEMVRVSEIFEKSLIQNGNVNCLVPFYRNEQSAPIEDEITSILEDEKFTIVSPGNGKVEVRYNYQEPEAKAVIGGNYAINFDNVAEVAVPMGRAARRAGGAAVVRAVPVAAARAPEPMQMVEMEAAEPIRRRGDANFAGEFRPPREKKTSKQFELMELFKKLGCVIREVRDYNCDYKFHVTFGKDLKAGKIFSRFENGRNLTSGYYPSKPVLAIRDSEKVECIHIELEDNDQFLATASYNII